MNRLHIIILSVFINTFSTSGFAQISKNDSILKIADSLVVSMTSLEYFNALERDSIPWISMLDMTELNNETYKKENNFTPHSVYYHYKRSINFNNLHTINEIGGMGPAGVFIELDENFKLINPNSFTTKSNAERQLIAFKRYTSGKFITVTKAKEIADKSFSPKTKSSYGNTLFIYDTNNDIFYWRIEKFKGFRKGTVEEVYINAESSKFVEKRTYLMSRTFWRALFNYRLL